MNVLPSAIAFITLRARSLLKRAGQLSLLQRPGIPETDK